MRPLFSFGWALSAAVVGAGFASIAADERVLIDFNRGYKPDLVAGTDAKAAVEGTEMRVLRVETGHQQPWPGVTLKPDGAPWDLSSFGRITVQLRNPESKPLTVFCRVDNPGADGTKNCVTGSVEIGGGKSATLVVPLKRASDDTLGGKLFGMRGYPVASGGPGTVNPANITQVLLFLSKPGADHAFEVHGVRASGTFQPPTAWTTDADPFLPCIDTFGQYRHKPWPGKVRSPADLAGRAEAEGRDLAARPGPAEWDRYGGWKTGPQLGATGFFRTQKHQGKWWLVDPEGRLFFSHGIDCVRMLDATPVQQRESWFEDFPGRDPGFAGFLSRGYALKGHYAGQQPQCFSFAGANFARKYGADWKTAYPQVIHRRLRSWGLNTIANWSDESLRLMRLTAYTDSLGTGSARRIEGSEGYWGKFPDVFDPSFAEALKRSADSRQNRSAGDPWCVGYFCDNELAWGDEDSFGLAALKSHPDQPAKRAFIEDLRRKHVTIERLNQAWGTACESWDALIASRETPDPAKARDDLRAFYTRVAEEYFRLARDAIRSVAPKQLFLGCRFAWVNARAAAAAAKYCDVVSYNLYQRSVAGFHFNGGADVPLIIGEFHFGALDRGMFHTGLVPVSTQEERAEAYRDYVRGALKHPQFVGCHWFQYQDEPTTGRVYDEENYQIGFVDIADTPYAETIDACRSVGYALYR